MLASALCYNPPPLTSVLIHTNLNIPFSPLTYIPYLRLSLLPFFPHAVGGYGLLVLSCYTYAVCTVHSRRMRMRSLRPLLSFVRSLGQPGCPSSLRLEDKIHRHLPLATYVTRWTCWLVRWLRGFGAMRYMYKPLDSYAFPPILN